MITSHSCYTHTHSHSPHYTLTLSPLHTLSIAPPTPQLEVELSRFALPGEQEVEVTNLSSRYGMNVVLCTCAESDVGVTFMVMIGQGSLLASSGDHQLMNW